MTTTTEAKTRVITLTDAQPVRVREDLWPVIASARDWDGEHESQAFRRWYLTVRQHADGRVIVYGRYTTQWQHESNRVGGERLAAGADIPAAIRRVGEHVGVSDTMIDSCVADLPAEDIDGSSAETTEDDADRALRVIDTIAASGGSGIDPGYAKDLSAAAATLRAALAKAARAEVVRVIRSNEAQ